MQQPRLSDTDNPLITQSYGPGFLLISNEHRFAKKIAAILAELYPDKVNLQTVKCTSDLRGFTADIVLLDGRLPTKQLEKCLDQITVSQSEPIVLLLSDEIADTSLEKRVHDTLSRQEISAPYLGCVLKYCYERGKILGKVFEKELKYRLLFERSIDPIFICDNDLRLINMNHALLGLFRSHKERMRMLPLNHLFENPPQYERIMEMLQEDGMVRYEEVNLKSADGKLITCLLSLMRLTGMDHHTKGYQGVIHDITERKKTEQKLLTAEKLAMTGRLARSIAHEVRNPLTNISLAIEQIEDEFGNMEGIELYTGMINRNVNRISGLVTDLLNAARLSELSPSTITVGKLVEESLKLAVDRLRLKNIIVKKSYENQDYMVYVDESKMRIALLNILINATEAIENGQGELLVSTKANGEYCVLTIADNGKGIADEDLKRIFDPFFSQKTGGSGLGLTTTQNIIHTHKGHLDVQSALGKGTKFTVHLPLMKREL